MKVPQHLLPIGSAIALASCSSTAPTIKQPVSFQPQPLSGTAETSQTEHLYNEINAYRKTKGAPELQRHAGLERLAQEHCEYMRKYRGTFSVYGKNVSHMGDAGRSLLAIRWYGMMNSCENVAWTETAGSPQQNAARLVVMWSESPDHDWAMSSESWTHTGVGTVVDADGSVFATQLFSTKNCSLFATAERLRE